MQHPSSSQIRHATEADLPAIVEIYNAAIPSKKVTGDIVPLTVEQRRTWFQAHDPTSYPIWVAEREQTVAGWLSLRPFYGRPAYRRTAELSIYVSPHHRRQGIGQTLLKHAIAHCTQLNLSTLLGFVFAQNTPSLALLTQLGFEQWGFLPNVAHFDTHSCDLVILGLAPLEVDNPEKEQTR
ncbi:MAG: GNAT family N-acetyltransferase [Leptolyngbyaceae bacterium]|nr:GNAT family N-acetyltransferase [Leptolyngbyaceae bacterium]